MRDFFKTIIPWVIAALALIVSFSSNFEKIRPRWRVSVTIAEPPSNFALMANETMTLAFVNEGTKPAAILEVTWIRRFGTDKWSRALEPIDFEPFTLEPGAVSTQTLRFLTDFKDSKGGGINTTLRVSFVMPGQRIIKWSTDFAAFRPDGIPETPEGWYVYENFTSAHLPGVEERPVSGRYMLPNTAPLLEPILLIDRSTWLDLY